MERHGMAVILMLGVFCAGARGQMSSRVLYTKSEVMIPMRDGVKLFTAVYQPRDTLNDYPLLIERTPYGVGPYGPQKYADFIPPSPSFTNEKYIYVYQDVRGRYMSEGWFVDVRPVVDSLASSADIDESTDAYDTIDWLIKNLRHHNGRAGLLGISYPGFYAAQGMIRAHPALKAVSPQAPVTDWFAGDDTHHNGAFFLSDEFSFSSGFGRPRPVPTTENAEGFQFTTADGYLFYLKLGALPHVNERYFKDSIAFWNDVMRHGRYDEFWRARVPLRHYTGVRPAVMVVGGWFDAEDLYGTLATYRTVKANNPGLAATLVMGPWSHGEWSGSDTNRLGHYRYERGTQSYFQTGWELPFFDFYLKDKGAGVPQGARVYDTGRRAWSSFAAWPPPDARRDTFFLNSQSRLTAVVPDAPGGFDECLSDPAKPVPYTATIAIGRTREYMTEDQRFTSTRPDVMVYESETFTGDMTAAGPIIADLFVSTTGTDADFVVKVIDVYPDTLQGMNVNGLPLGGTQQMVRAEIMRGKFRRSLEFPEPFVPGMVDEVRFTLPDVFHTFVRGHRLMVQVQYSWFPLVDRNPQKFLDINNAHDGDFVKAVQRIHRSPAASSHIELPVLR